MAESREHDGAVYGVAFSPDGAQFASCSADRTIKLWTVAQASVGAAASTRPALSDLGDVIERMLDAQQHGRSSILVVDQDTLEEMGACMPRMPFGTQSEASSRR